MKATATLHSYPDDTPLRDQQVRALNAALTAEVLRHAETRQALGQALVWGWLVRERIAPVDVVREVPMRFTRHIPWTPGTVRPTGRFPLGLAERTGIAALIQRRLLLRSGAVLDPVGVEVRRGQVAAAFPDSSWLLLCLLAHARGGYVPSGVLSAEIFGGGAGNSLRSAVYRTRVALAVVGAQDDLELAPDRKAGWRLLLAEARHE